MPIKQDAQTSSFTSGPHQALLPHAARDGKSSRAAAVRSTLRIQFRVSYRPWNRGLEGSESVSIKGSFIYRENKFRVVGDSKDPGGSSGGWGRGLREREGGGK